MHQSSQKGKWNDAPMDNIGKQYWGDVGAILYTDFQKKREWFEN
jgi:hypothetical protein